MIVTIDGPAGTGKSTIARRIGEETDLFYVNSGLLYRGYAWYLLNVYGDRLDAVLANEVSKLVDTAKQCSIDIHNDSLDINGVTMATNELRSDRVDSWVAQVSAIPEIRDLVNQILKKISRSRSIVVEGRDMSTLVFPDADLKFYLDASIEARARRRFEQGTSRLTLSDVEARIRERDEIDLNKEVGALKQSEDAVYLDTSDLTIDQVCEIVLRSIREHK